MLDYPLFCLFITGKLFLCVTFQTYWCFQAAPPTRWWYGRQRKHTWNELLVPIKVDLLDFRQRLMELSFFLFQINIVPPFSSSLPASCRHINELLIHLYCNNPTVFSFYRSFGAKQTKSARLIFLNLLHGIFCCFSWQKHHKKSFCCVFRSIKPKPFISFQNSVITHI